MIPGVPEWPEYITIDTHAPDGIPIRIRTTQKYPSKRLWDRLSFITVLDDQGYLIGRSGDKTCSVYKFSKEDACFNENGILLHYLVEFESMMDGNIEDVSKNLPGYLIRRALS